jgi:hypothetical protein
MRFGEENGVHTGGLITANVKTSGFCRDVLPLYSLCKKCQSGRSGFMRMLTRDGERSYIGPEA